VYNSEMYLRERGWGVIDWIHLAQDREDGRIFVNTVTERRDSVKCF
jgi:uncharacterized protein YebE (UPF0316 family)